VKVSDAELDQGTRAKVFLTSLVKESCYRGYIKPESEPFDCFGRVLGRLFLRNYEGHLIDVAEVMIKQGFTR
jgi:endonuclease YncB( thermonuclease family)